MDSYDYLLDSLNAPQRKAVSSPPRNMLVIAGAGSGKTRVLTHRIAWLIQQQQNSPYDILAVTFTNKAAHEMRGRIESLLGMRLASMWVGTFHGLSHRLLRTHWQAAKLPESFQILDADDQFRLIKRLQRQLELDETRWAPKQTQWFINKQKEQGLRAHQAADLDNSYFTETLCRVYRAYEALCQRSGLVDFTELLLRSLELLNNNPDIREHYQARFKHILIDEFQDTNTIQYAWLKAFKSPHNYFMAVGDDDQSIYSWRGACIDNIHRFDTELPDVETIRLEQNYRSTQTILDAANSVIANNSNRLGKQLWTEENKGTPITLYSAFNERDEAYYISACIRQWLNQGRRAKDVAILYRSNAQSRILEEYLIDAKIPYRIYGGLKFFERAEIKDALAYLRIISNRDDDAAFERAVNMPTRGIGNSTLALLRTTARENSMSLWQAAIKLISNDQLSTRAANALNGFLTLINALDDETKDALLGEQCEKIIITSGLLAHYKKDKSEKGISKVENLEELINATSLFKPAEEEVTLSMLSAFLSHVALETGEEQAATHTDCVNLMTLHAAKGLEFSLVFISGLEEELFPHRMSIDDGGLEEERRLCYVGMTRAMQKLIMTYAESRRLHGMDKFTEPSRFINEIPQTLMLIERPKAKVARPTHSQPTRLSKPANQQGLYVGQRVKHKKFGNGVILNYEGQGENTRIQVRFDQHGSKWLVASYAKLTPV